VQYFGNGEEWGGKENSVAGGERLKKKKPQKKVSGRIASGKKKPLHTFFKAFSGGKTGDAREREGKGACGIWGKEPKPPS